MATWLLNIATVLAFSLTGRNENCEGVTPVSKFQLVSSPAGPSLVYMRGCTNLPTDSSDCNVLTRFSMVKKTKQCLPLVPFGGRIVDILYLQLCEDCLCL